MSQRHAVTKKMAAAYKRGTKSEKTVILDGLVKLTGWHRDHARPQARWGLMCKIHVLSIDASHCGDATLG